MSKKRRKPAPLVSGSPTPTPAAPTLTPDQRALKCSAEIRGVLEKWNCVQVGQPAIVRLPPVTEGPVWGIGLEIRVAAREAIEQR